MMKCVLFEGLLIGSAILIKVYNFCPIYPGHVREALTAHMMAKKLAESIFVRLGLYYYGPGCCVLFAVFFFW